MEGEVVGRLRARVATWRHGNPSRALKLIAVAGTHGKTTTVLLLAELLKEAGNSVMTLTNQGSALNGETLNGRYDQSADSLLSYLSKAKKRNVNYVVVEISNDLIRSHVLSTLDITMSVITNDSSDARTLLNQPVDYAVVPAVLDITSLTVVPHQAITFGDNESAEAVLGTVTERRRGTEIELTIDHQIKLQLATYLVGRANALNVAAVVAAAYVLAIDTATFDEGIARLEGVTANYQYLPSGDLPYDMVVDGAHDEVAVSLVVDTAARLKRRRLLVVADESIPSELYPAIKNKVDRLIIVGDTPELPGADRVASAKEGVDLAARGAKKDDLLLLVGSNFAAPQPDGGTFAHTLVGPTDE